MKPLRQKKPIPHAFVLDALESIHPVTRSMFGCLAVYRDERIFLILRDREDYPDDNGVWLATSGEHHATLRSELPSLREVRLLAGGKPTNWQNLPAAGSHFEEECLRACELILMGDVRIGRVPKSKSKTKVKTTAKSQSKRKTKSSKK